MWIPLTFQGVFCLQRRLIDVAWCIPWNIHSSSAFTGEFWHRGNLGDRSHVCRFPEIYGGSLLCTPIAVRDAAKLHLKKGDIMMDMGNEKYFWLAKDNSWMIPWLSVHMDAVWFTYEMLPKSHALVLAAYKRLAMCFAKCLEESFPWYNGCFIQWFHKKCKFSINCMNYLKKRTDWDSIRN